VRYGLHKARTEGGGGERRGGGEEERRKGRAALTAVSVHDLVVSLRNLVRHLPAV
jgi:hypothetical protein